MNKKTFLIFFLMAVPVIFGLGSCLTNKEIIETYNSKNNLDWEGVYSVSFQTERHFRYVRMKLNNDQSFEAYYEYADKSHEPINIRGPFKWDDTGNIIMIDVIDAPIQYKVAKDTLIRLDAHDYVLVKER